MPIPELRHLPRVQTDPIHTTVTVTVTAILTVTVTAIGCNGHCPVCRWYTVIHGTAVVIDCPPEKGGRSTLGNYTVCVGMVSSYWG